MKTMKTLLSASLALTALSGCQPETEKPNILFLLVDDMQRALPVQKTGTGILPVLRS